MSLMDACGKVSYLPLLLTQNAKLKIKRHSVFIEGGYEFWSLEGRVRRRKEKTQLK